MFVKQLADQTGVTTDTVRYYTRLGLLSPSKSSNGYHRFSVADQRRMRFCVLAKRLGFSLAEIQRLFEMAGNGQSPCPEARQILASNLERVRRELDESGRLLERMEQASKLWQALPDREPAGHDVCHLIESWQADE